MEEKQAELARFRHDALYHEAHLPELLQEYPEHWVAIFNKEVAGADTDFDRLLDQLKQSDIPAERSLALPVPGWNILCPARPNIVHLR